MKPLWTPPPVRIKTTSMRLGDGINNGLPPFEIGESFATDAQNIDSREYPALNVRPPRSDFGTALSGPIRHLGARQDDYITVVDGTTWKYWNGSSWATILSGLAAANAKSIDFMGKTILVDGTNEKYWDGATSGDVGGGMPNSDFLTVHANRIYAASKTSQTLSFSALRKYNDWTTAEDAGFIVAETRDGEGASGLTTYANHVVLFKEHSMHELYGTGPLNYSFNVTSDKIGCISDRSIKEVKGRLLWLGYDGVYMYGGGTLPKLISYPHIHGYIKRLDIANRSKASAGTDGERYYLCLPIDSGGKILVVYDTRLERWYVEDNIDIVEFVEFNNILYGVTSAGQIKKMIDPAGTESISWYWTGKPMNEGAISQEKSWFRLYFIVDLPTGSTLTCALSNDAEGSSFTTVKTLTASSNIQKAQIEVPFDIAQNADWVRIKLSGTGPCTVHAMEKQLRMVKKAYA